MLLIIVIVKMVIRRKAAGNKSATNPPQNIQPAEYLPKNSIGRPNGRKKIGRGLDRPEK